MIYFYNDQHPQFPINATENAQSQSMEAKLTAGK